MNVFNKYNIAFNGLSAGDHDFGFDVGDDLFEAFEGSEIKHGKAHADVVLHKASGVLTLSFRITGRVTVECDRCLEDCDLPVDYTGQLAVKFTDRELEAGEEYDGEVLWLNPQAGELNVAQYIYESIALSLPYQRVHPDGADGKPSCNPDMLARFGIITEEEFERMAAGDQYSMEMGEGADKLLELKQKMEKEGGK